MYMPDVELHEARTLVEAAGLLSRFAPQVRLLAGGTDLLVDLKAGRVATNHLVAVGQIAELHGIRETDEGLRIGALTTITQLDRSPIVRARFAAIRDATTQMAAPQIRNVATVGGNVVSAVPCADLPPIFTAINAWVVIWSPAGERIVQMDALFEGVRRTVLRQDEVLTAIVIPYSAARSGAAYARFSHREGNSISVAGVAAAIQLDADNLVADARIVLGAVSPTPKLVDAARAALIGRRVDDDAIAKAAEVARDAALPISDIRGTADFRRRIVGVMTRRALLSARDRAMEVTG